MGSISLTGMLFVELQEYFGASTTYLSLFGSIKMGLILFLGTITITIKTNSCSIILAKIIFESLE